MAQGLSRRQKRLTLEAIFDSKTFDEKTLRQPQWLKDHRRLSYLDYWPGTESTTVWIYDSETHGREPLFDPTGLQLVGAEKPFAVHAYQWSPDERSLLFPGDPPARFKPCGDLFLYSLETQSFRRFTDCKLPQRNPKFSSDGQWIGLMRGDDLWLLSTTTGEERRLTHDASETVYNGRFGWVYEEELHLVDGWLWSPDGAHIAYYQQAESEVPTVLLSDYEDLHAASQVTRYPKAGDPNPGVRIGVLTLETGETRWLDIDPGEEFYIARLQWTPSGNGLLIQRLPRLQNRIDLLFADLGSGEIRTVLTEEDPAWVDAPGDLTFVAETDTFLWPSERAGYRHLYLYDFSGRCLRRITEGDWDVDQIVGVDAKRQRVLFTAARPSPTERALYRVGLDGSSPVALTHEEGWHRAIASADGSRLLLTHSTVDRPPIVAVLDGEGAVLDTLISDSIPLLERYALRTWDFLTFTTSDGETLHARMLRPRNFSPSRHYPVLMHTYGGPGSQVVTNAWGGKNALWSHVMAQAGYVIFMVDNRGTGGRGRDFKKQVYRKLGHWEVHDQIEGARHLATLPYVDPKRIGIWGWSYGGYMASLCMLLGADVFRAGIAVAPVTDWTLYDSIYTERYMRRPEENPEGYRDTSPVRLAERLTGRFLLIHGLMDDNVHFQNAARLASALQDAKKPFATMVYPGKHHGIEDRHQHLFGLMTEFVRKNL